MTSSILAICCSSLVLAAVTASAQSFEASVHLASSQWSEFDGTDLGVGGRLTWKPSPMIGVDADLTWYPGDFHRTAFRSAATASKDCSA